MSIRRKLTLLLLLMVLVPLVVSRLVTASISWQASSTVARDMRAVLVRDAEQSLLTVTEDFSRLLDTKEKVIELLGQLQSQKVEKRIVDAMLAKEGYKIINRPIKTMSSLEPELLTVPDTAPHETFAAIDLLRPIREVPLPGVPNFRTIDDFGLDTKIDTSGVRLPNRYFPVDPRSGKPLTPFDVSYQKQRCYTIGKVNEKESEQRRLELEALRTMTASYWMLRQMTKQGILWQYTILESGVMTFYPSSVASDTVGDLREADFYIRMKKEQKVFFSPPVIDRITGLTVIIVAVPLFYPDGSFAGMTGMDLITESWFEDLRLPVDWGKNATAMLIKRMGPYAKTSGQTVVLAKKTPKGRMPKEIEESKTAGRRIQLPVLKAVDPERLKQIIDQAESGKSGIVRMKFNDKESLWAFGPAREGQTADEPFLLVVVPEETITSQADENERYILETAANERWITGAIFLGVALIAAVIGFGSATTVTRPIGQIAEAGIRLSEGNYHAHVDIRTGDELQRLGEIFNETGPKLLEREKMLHSLAMAMEVQQQLLPQAPPECKGLDIAGESDYCDETGGDYFDYLTFPEREEGDEDDATRLGVAIADVSGHGIGAALIMASVRSVLRSHAASLQDRLDQLMYRLNRSVTDSAQTGHFVTLCYSLFDPKRRTLRWISAGHDPALHLHRDPSTGQQTVDELPNSGVPLGVLDDAEYEAMGPITLGDGDVVVFGTDGAWETTNTNGEAFGKERLRQILLDQHDQPANTIRQAIITAITTFRGTAPQLDDITLVVVKVQ